MTINKKGLQEIYELAGPFCDDKKNCWVQLLLQRKGKRGGYQKIKKATEDKLTRSS